MTRSAGPRPRPARCSTTWQALGISYDDVVEVLEREGVREVRRVLGRAGRRPSRSLSTKPRPGSRIRAQAHRRPWMTTSSDASTRTNPLRDPHDRRLPRIAGPCVLVIFGVTGDLSTKKLMPAVYDLANRGLLPPGFALVGFARRGVGSPGLRQGGPRRRPAERAHTVPRRGLAAALGGHSVRARRDRRRGVIRRSDRHDRRPGRGARYRRKSRVLSVDSSRAVPDRWSISCARTGWRSNSPASGAG